MDYKIEKTTAECYNLRGPYGTFANITLDYSGNQGRISIASDFGNWSHYWGSCGEAFKEFLIGLNLEYAAGKFGESNWFDHQSTLNYLENRIEDCANNKHHKNELLRQLKDLKDCTDKEHFIATIVQCEDIFNMEDQQPELMTGISPSFKRFWETLWTFFISSLKEELESAQPA